jgi:hypothetical protein
MVRRKKGTAAAASGGRGSPEAIAKRRIARKLNALFTGGAEAGTIDGRTAKRRQRLLTELDKGTKKGGKGMKPIELLQRVNELLDIGEKVSSIRKVVHTRAASLPPGSAAEILREVHTAYHFRPESYRFLGVPHDALVAAKIVSAEAPRRGRPPKKAR